jgi:N-acetylglutamate synthase-like GNAT family acetyltransferase
MASFLPPKLKDGYKRLKWNITHFFNGKLPIEEHPDYPPIWEPHARNVMRNNLNYDVLSMARYYPADWSIDGQVALAKSVQEKSKQPEVRVDIVQGNSDPYQIPRLHRIMDLWQKTALIPDKNRIIDLVHDPQNVFLTMEIDNMLAGAVGFRTDLGENHAELLGLATAFPYRDQGVAGYLMRTMEGILRENEVDVVWASVPIFSKDLFERWGFSPFTNYVSDWMAFSSHGIHRLRDYRAYEKQRKKEGHLDYAEVPLILEKHLNFDSRLRSELDPDSRQRHRMLELDSLHWFNESIERIPDDYHRRGIWEDSNAVKRPNMYEMDLRAIFSLFDPDDEVYEWWPETGKDLFANAEDAMYDSLDRHERTQKTLQKVDILKEQFPGIDWQTMYPNLSADSDTTNILEEEFLEKKRHEKRLKGLKLDRSDFLWHDGDPSYAGTRRIKKYLELRRREKSKKSQGLRTLGEMEQHGYDIGLHLTANDLSTQWYQHGFAAKPDTKWLPLPTSIRDTEPVTGFPVSPPQHVLPYTDTGVPQIGQPGVGYPSGGHIGYNMGGHRGGMGSGGYQQQQQQSSGSSYSSLGMYSNDSNVFHTIRQSGGMLRGGNAENIFHMNKVLQNAQILPPETKIGTFLDSINPFYDPKNPKYGKIIEIPIVEPPPIRKMDQGTQDFLPSTRNWKPDIESSKSTVKIRLPPGEDITLPPDICFQRPLRPEEIQNDYGHPLNIYVHREKAFPTKPSMFESFRSKIESVIPWAGKTVTQSDYQVPVDERTKDGHNILNYYNEKYEEALTGGLNVRASKWRWRDKIDFAGLTGEEKQIALLMDHEEDEFLANWLEDAWLNRDFDFYRDIHHQDLRQRQNYTIDLDNHRNPNKRDRRTFNRVSEFYSDPFSYAGTQNKSIVDLPDKHKLLGSMNRSVLSSLGDLRHFASPRGTVERENLHFWTEDDLAEPTEYLDGLLPPQNKIHLAGPDFVLSNQAADGFDRSGSSYYDGTLPQDYNQAQYFAPFHDQNPLSGHTMVQNEQGNMLMLDQNGHVVPNFSNYANFSQDGQPGQSGQQGHFSGSPQDPRHYHQQPQYNRPIFNTDGTVTYPTGVGLHASEGLPISHDVTRDMLSNFRDPITNSEHKRFPDDEYYNPMGKPRTIFDAKKGWRLPPYKYFLPWKQEGDRQRTRDALDYRSPYLRQYEKDELFLYDNKNELGPKLFFEKYFKLTDTPEEMKAKLTRLDHLYNPPEQPSNQFRYYKDWERALLEDKKTKEIAVENRKKFNLQDPRMRFIADQVGYKHPTETVADRLYGYQYAKNNEYTKMRAKQLQTLLGPDPESLLRTLDTQYSIDGLPIKDSRNFPHSTSARGTSDYASEIAFHNFDVFNQKIPPNSQLVGFQTAQDHVDRLYGSNNITALTNGQPTKIGTGGSFLSSIQAHKDKKFDELSELDYYGNNTNQQQQFPHNVPKNDSIFDKAKGLVSSVFGTQQDPQHGIDALFQNNHPSQSIPNFSQNGQPPQNLNIPQHVFTQPTQNQFPQNTRPGPFGKNIPASALIEHSVETVGQVRPTDSFDLLQSQAPNSTTNIERLESTHRQHLSEQSSNDLKFAQDFPYTQPLTSIMGGKPVIKAPLSTDNDFLAPLTQFYTNLTNPNAPFQPASQPPPFPSPMNNSLLGGIVGADGNPSKLSQDHPLFKTLTEQHPDQSLEQIEQLFHQHQTNTQYQRDARKFPQTEMVELIVDVPADDYYLHLRREPNWENLKYQSPLPSHGANLPPVRFPDGSAPHEHLPWNKDPTAPHLLLYGRERMIADPNMPERIFDLHRRDTYLKNHMGNWKLDTFSDWTDLVRNAHPNIEYLLTPKQAERYRELKREVELRDQTLPLLMPQLQPKHQRHYLYNEDLKTLPNQNSAPTTLNNMDSTIDLLDDSTRRDQTSDIHQNYIHHLQGLSKISHHDQGWQSDLGIADVRPLNDYNNRSRFEETSDYRWAQEWAYRLQLGQRTDEEKYAAGLIPIEAHMVHEAIRPAGDHSARIFHAVDDPSELKRARDLAMKVYPQYNDDHDAIVSESNKYTLERYKDLQEKQKKAYYTRKNEMENKLYRYLIMEGLGDQQALREETFIQSRDLAPDHLVPRKLWDSPVAGHRYIGDQYYLGATKDPWYGAGATGAGPMGRIGTVGQTKPAELVERQQNEPSWGTMDNVAGREPPEQPAPSNADHGSYLVDAFWHPL